MQPNKNTVSNKKIKHIDHTLYPPRFFTEHVNEASFPSFTVTSIKLFVISGELDPQKKPEIKVDS